MFTKNTIIIIIILFYYTFLFIEYFFIGFFQFFTFQDVSWIFWKYVLFCIGNSMICSDIWHKYHGWYFKIVIGNFMRLSQGPEEFRVNKWITYFEKCLYLSLTTIN